MARRTAVPPPDPGPALGRRTFLQIAAAVAATAGIAPAITDAAPASALVASGPQPPAPSGAAILLDETFAFLNDFDPRQLTASGWELRSLGGTVASAFGSWFRLTDDGSAPVVGMAKKFRAVGGRALSWEFRFQPLAAVDGSRWALLAPDGTPGIELTVADGTLHYLAPDGPVSLGAIAVNGKYGVRVVADPTAGTLCIDFNGQRVVTDAALSAAAAELDTVVVETGADSDFYLGPIRVATGYRLLEDFVSVDPGDTPSRWSASATGQLAVAKLNHSRQADNHSLHVIASGGPATVSTPLAASTASSTVEVSFYAPTNVNGLVIEVWTGNGRWLRVSVAASKLLYRNGSGTDTAFSFVNFPAGIWHHLRVELTGIRADLFHNGKKKAGQVTLAPAAADATPLVRFTVADGGTAYFDDVRITDRIEYPADYVPAPVAVSTGGYLVGAQSCSIWREGYHHGWDAINPFRERRPLLGYYDEGSPEVADWETKWFVENGVTFQLYCWYRPQGGKGTAIKMPRLGMHLHEGFFRSRYSDSMKFAIMWENSGEPTDSADFRKNIAPFWLEYYFKDARYLTVDNKPVLSIYNIAALVSNFGSEAGARAEIDYLRSLVQSAGFADLIVLGTGNAATPALGFDAEYSYSRKGYFGPQTAAMLSRRTASAVDVLATLSIGRDDLAWNDLVGELASPETYGDLAVWARDTFMPSAPAGALSQRMVILDNWNEFGEGHYLFPNEGTGFGHLEAVRSAFGTAQGSANTAPTAAQVDRVTTLYPADRVFPPVNSVVPAKSEEFTVEWLFDTDGDLQGWSDLHGTLDQLRVEGGALRATSTTTDPVVQSPDALALEAANHPYVRIKTSASLPSEQEFYFITPEEGTYARDKGMTFCVEPVPGVNNEYDIAVWRIPKWRGTIQRFRIDPMVMPGTFAIESVKVMHVPSPAPRAQLNGKVYPELYLQESGGAVVIPAEFVCRTLGLPSSFEALTGKYLVRHAGSLAEATVGSTTAVLDGTPFTLDVAPALGSYGEPLLPLSFFVGGLGATAGWDGSTLTLDIP